MINKRLKDVLFTDQWSEVCMDTLSRFGYVLVSNNLRTLSHTHTLATLGLFDRNMWVEILRKIYVYSRGF